MRYFSKIATLAAGILLGVVVSFASARVFKKSIEIQSFSMPARDAEPLQEMGQRDLLSQETLSSTILIDAILTIVQNYYVDEGRANNEKGLMLSTMSFLQDHYKIGVSLGRDKILLKYKNLHKHLDLSGHYSYDRLIQDAVEITKFLQKIPLHILNISEYYEVKNPGVFVFLNSLLRSLDPHSSLMDSEDYRELRQGTEGSFGGLGVVVGMQDNVLTVIKPLPKSPAAKAGISGNDRIVFINEVSTFGTSLQNLVQHMRGDPGTEVKLSLLRNGELAPRELRIRREVIQVDSLTESVKNIGDNRRILEIQIDGFSSRTAEEIAGSITRNSERKDLDGIIIDLRGNPGGLLDQAVKASDIFMDSGTIVSTEGRKPEFEIAYRDKSDCQLPVIVIVDNNTASASEILAGALQDNNRALIIGQPTFGKGSVQTVFELPANQALKLTIARYFTPSGKSIQNSGIMPDIWTQPVKEHEDNYDLLGTSRYGSERFLGNSLKNFRPVRSYPDHKLYYLERDDDFERNLAYKIFANTYRKYRPEEWVNLKRASYLLAKNSKTIRRTVRNSSSEVTRYLTDEHKIPWNLPSTLKKLPRALLKLPKRNHRNIKEGDFVKIPFLIKNYGNTPLYNTAVYIYSQNSQISAKEKLVGTIPAKGYLKGYFDFEVSLPARENSYHIRMGIASDANPIPGMFQEFNMKVVPSEKPDIEYSLSLVDEQGGLEDGLLEAGESATLEVIVKNNSDITAHNILASLSNFAGQQIHFEKSQIAAKYLKGRSEKRFRFPVKVSKKLISHSLHLGLTIDTKEHLQPFIKNHFVKAKPN